MGKGNDHDRYVVQNEERGGWDVVKEDHERASAHYDTQRAAEQRAKQIVENLGGDGEVRIQGRDGRWRDSDSGSSNESPRKDTRH